MLKKIPSRSNSPGPVKGKDTPVKKNAEPSVWI